MEVFNDDAREGKGEMSNFDNLIGGGEFPEDVPRNLLFPSQKSQLKTDVEDFEKAFPTAQMVSYWRAIDAESDSPQIGKPINAGPDLAAKHFCGEIGKQISDDYVGIAGITNAIVVSSIVKRTNYYDKMWMKAHEDGVRQFVILASGMDARAWRIPDLHGCTVFEVDVPQCHTFKRTKIPLLDMYALECTRVEVDADLSEPSWTETLKSSGYDSSQISFFMLEGLTMYLPPGAVENLLKAIADIICVGSYVTGGFFNTLEPWTNLPSHNVLLKYGTKWTWASTKENMMKILTAVGLVDTEIKLLIDKDKQMIEFHKNDREIDDDKAKRCAEGMIGALKFLPSCAEVAIPWAKQYISKGDEGITELLKEMCEDKTGQHGLQEESDEMKARVVELALERGFIHEVKTQASKLVGINVDFSTAKLWWVFCGKKGE